MIDVVAVLSHPLVMDTDNPTTLRRYLGGQATNTASWLTSLGQPTVLIGAVGDDPNGAWVEAEMDAGGLDRVLHHAAAPTGECIVLVTPDGQRTMVPSTGANALIGSTPALESMQQALSPGSSHLHISGYLPYHDGLTAQSALTNAKEAGATTSIDTASTPQLRQHREQVLGLLPDIDVLIGSRPELAVLADLPDPDAFTSADLLERLRQETGSTAIVVLKAGADGSYVDDGDAGTHVSAVQVDVVDTTGAGDALSAGFLAAWTTGWSPADSLRNGTTVAARAITTLGATPRAMKREGTDGH